MLNLKELTKNRIYRIPDYQRGYSWEKKQIQELIDDIQNIRLEKQTSYHFTGILSYSKISVDQFNEKENTSFSDNQELEFYHITDGQQRLTTMFILLFEIYKIQFPENFNQKFLDSILTVNHNGTRVYKFGYDKDVPSREHLYNVIFEDENYKINHPETLYTNNLDNAKIFIKELLLSMDEGKLKRFQRKLEQRLLFQEFVIDTSKLDVSMVFETMNYRGKNLSKLELFKNRLIYLVGNNPFISDNQVIQLRRRVTEAWLNVYSWLGKKSDVKLNDDSFLVAFTIIYFDNQHTIDSEFKSIIDSLFKHEFPINTLDNPNLSESQIIKISESIENLVKSYYVSFNPYASQAVLGDIVLSKRIKSQLYIINQIGGANYIKVLITAAIAFYHSNPNNPENEFLMFLLEVEKHQMIVFNLLGRKINANRPDIFRICHGLYSGQISLSSARQKVEELTNHWWVKRQVVNIVQDKLNETKERFLNLNGLKTLLFLKEVHQNTLPDEIQKIGDYRLELIFQEGYGANVKFPNVVRSRGALSVDYLRFSLGNIMIIERKIQDKSNVASHNYFDIRINQISQSSNPQNKLIASKLVKWSDVDILKRGYEIMYFIKERYQLDDLKDEDIRHILVDDLVIQQTVNPS